MAKVSGGLLSLGASGTIGKTVTFGTWRGVNYARQRVTPANPNSTGQQSTRNAFSVAGSIWKQAPTLLVAPWSLFATGRPFTNRNAFQGQYVRELRGKPALADMVFSPGAKGGLVQTSTTPVATSGGIDITLVPPTPPTGWTLVGAIAAAIVDGDPETLTDFTVTAGEDLTDPYTVVLTGLGQVQYQFGAWLQWTKEDGSPAYGPSVGGQATPLA